MTMARIWIGPVATMVIIAGTVGVSQATGAWVTSGRQVVTSTTVMGIDDLKGWMTLQQAADGLGVPVAELIAALDAPPGVEVAPATAFKDLESLVPGFELSAFREVLRARLG
ncbi:MAG TPA: hypothetical protein VHO26_01605 [Propionibacteriaceae bacterium]|nr:hypothetical protein [Propionibacteriaceae bacterium]